MKQALRAEWAKAWSDHATAWLLVALVAATVAVSAITITTSRCAAAGCGQDPAKISFAGVWLGQAVAALIGVLAIGGEYDTGMIRVTLTAMPRRGRLLAAKALVLAGPVLAASAVATAACMLIGWLVLPAHGFTAANGFDLFSGAMWRAWLCALAYLTLVAMLGLGVATAVRDAAVGVGAALALLYLFPVIALAAGQAVQRWVERIGPMSAGMDSQATVALRGLPLTPWQGLGVVTLWAAGTLILGTAVLRKRDA
jgi:ABC-2 type transport system permease protein